MLSISLGIFLLVIGQLQSQKNIKKHFTFTYQNFGILLAYLTKTNNEQYKKDVWIGSGIAIILSIIGAIIFQQFLGGFEGDAEKLFEGIAMIVAALFLSWMIIWMFRNGRFLQIELQEKLKVAIDKNSKFALVGISFM